MIHKKILQKDIIEIHIIPKLIDRIEGNDRHHSNKIYITPQIPTKLPLLCQKIVPVKVYGKKVSYTRCGKYIGICKCQD